MVVDATLELGRLARLRNAIASAGCQAGVFYDPVNIRYATGTSNMQVYSLHTPCRYIFVPVDRPVVLFDFMGCAHLSAGRPSDDEVCDATSWYYFVPGPRTAELATRWVGEIAGLLGPARIVNRRAAIDRLDLLGLESLNVTTSLWSTGKPWQAWRG